LPCFVLQSCCFLPSNVIHYFFQHPLVDTRNDDFVI